MDADRAAARLVGGESARPSEACEDFIKGWEACRLTPYLDSVGRPTIGWGHLLLPTDAREPITQDEADSLFLLDLMPIGEAVARLIFMPVQQNQYDAAVDFSYNLGTGAFAGSTLRKRINGGYFDQAANEFAKWGNGKDPHTGLLMEIPGVMKRRLAERAMFESGIYTGRP